MNLNINYDEATESNGLLPAGEYETIIKFAGEDVTRNGTIYISIVLVFRNDIEQGYKNKYIWHQLWKRKNPTNVDIDCSGYGARDIQTLSKAAGLQNGKKYDGFDEWFADLQGKVISVTIKHEEFNGEQQVKVRYVNPSKYPECKHVWKSNNPASPEAVAARAAESRTGSEDFVEIDADDDLPF